MRQLPRGAGPRKELSDTEGGLATTELTKQTRQVCHTPFGTEGDRDTGVSNAPWEGLEGCVAAG